MFWNGRNHTGRKSATNKHSKGGKKNRKLSWFIPIIVTNAARAAKTEWRSQPNRQSSVDKKAQSMESVKKESNFSRNLNFVERWDYRPDKKVIMPCDQKRIQKALFKKRISGSLWKRKQRPRLRSMVHRSLWSCPKVFSLIMTLE